MELYAVAICESWIYVKCPYNVKQGIHLVITTTEIYSTEERK